MIFPGSARKDHRRQHLSSVSERHSHHRQHHRRDGGSRDLEHEIIKNRIILTIVTLTGLFFFYPTPEALGALSVHFTGAAILAIWYYFDSRTNYARRILGLITDFGVAGYCLMVDGQGLAVFYPLYLWVILGNGFRFGVKWLYASAAMAFVSFGFAISRSPYWADNGPLAISLILALLIIPAYCSTLITGLSRAKEEAEEANRAKSFFLASISHELRTPLNAIIGYGTFMLGMDISQKQKQMVSTSVTAGKHLLHLINQLLSFAKADSEKNQPELGEYAPAELIKEVYDIMELSAKEKSLTFNIQAQPMSDLRLIGNTDYIKNILLNLCSNAIKFTDQGQIILHCGIERENAEQEVSVWFSVTDDGPGIPKQSLSRIFEAFQQADRSISKTYGGTGLGLAICQQQAGQMGGRVAVESTVGEGSTFTLYCPSTISEASAESLSPPATEKLAILSLGQSAAAPELESDDHSVINLHHFSSTPQELAEILQAQDLTQFEIALVDEKLAADLSSDDVIWDIFKAHQLAPVLLTDGAEQRLEDIKLRAAFAATIPCGAHFDTIRSVIRIGCSFRGQEVEISPDTVKPISIPRQVLVADDNRTNRMVIETILTNAGHSVVLAKDGEEALQTMEKRAFDIVFMDVNMPVVDGIASCKMWRQSEKRGQHLPIIGLTADATEETERQCLNAGMDMRLTKPIEAGNLLSIIDSTLGGNDSQTSPPREAEQISDPMEKVHALEGGTYCAKEATIDMAQLSYLQSIGDEEFVQSVITTYLEDAQEISLSLQAAVEDHNIKDFRFHAHAFKSGAANIGATGLAELCGYLEVITQEEFDAHSRDHWEEVQRSLADVCSLLQAPDLLVNSDQNDGDQNNSDHRQII